MGSSRWRLFAEVESGMLRFLPLVDVVGGLGGSVRRRA